MSSLSNDNAIGRLARLPLRLIPSGAVVPVIRGPLSGRRWIVGAATHGCWLGTYERDKQQRFWAAASTARVIFDVGANVGFYTLLAATAPTRPTVFAFEPAPRNVAFLERHLSLNGLDAVKVIEAAVSDRAGTVRFASGPNASMGHIADDGGLQVTAVTLDDLLLDGTVAAPDLMKIDVEGAELLALDGAQTLIERHRPVIFLATHSRELHASCVAWLTARAYRLEMLDADEILAFPS